MKKYKKVNILYSEEAELTHPVYIEDGEDPIVAFEREVDAGGVDFSNEYTICSDVRPATVTTVFEISIEEFLDYIKKNNFDPEMIDPSEYMFPIEGVAKTTLEMMIGQKIHFAISRGGSIEVTCEDTKPYDVPEFETESDFCLFYNEHDNEFDTVISSLNEEKYGMFVTKYLPSGRYFECEQDENDFAHEEVELIAELSIKDRSKEPRDVLDLIFPDTKVCGFNKDHSKFFWFKRKKDC